MCAETDFVPHIVGACARLHNFSIDRSDEWPRSASSASCMDAGFGAGSAVDLVGESYARARALRQEVVDDLRQSCD